MCLVVLFEPLFVKLASPNCLDVGGRYIRIIGGIFIVLCSQTLLMLDYSVTESDRLLYILVQHVRLAVLVRMEDWLVRLSICSIKLLDLLLQALLFLFGVTVVLQHVATAVEGRTSILSKTSMLFASHAFVHIQRRTLLFCIPLRSVVVILRVAGCLLGPPGILPFLERLTALPLAKQFSRCTCIICNPHSFQYICYLFLPSAELLLMSLLDDLIPQLGTLKEYLGQPLLLLFISTEL